MLLILALFDDVGCHWTNLISAGMETSLHHVIACWCDNQAQRNERQQVGDYPCVYMAVIHTEGKIFFLYQDEFVWSSSREAGIFIDGLLWSSQRLKHVWEESLEKKNMVFLWGAVEKLAVFLERQKVNRAEQKCKGHRIGLCCCSTPCTLAARLNTQPVKSSELVLAFSLFKTQFSNPGVTEMCDLTCWRRGGRVKKRNESGMQRRRMQKGQAGGRTVSFRYKPKPVKVSYVSFS